MQYSYWNEYIRQIYFIAVSSIALYNLSRKISLKIFLVHKEKEKIFQF